MITIKFFKMVRHAHHSEIKTNFSFFSTFYSHMIFFGIKQVQMNLSFLAAHLIIVESNTQQPKNNVLIRHVWLPSPPKFHFLSCVDFHMSTPIPEGRHPLS